MSARVSPYRILAAVLLLVVSPAAAKVVFTGYGDFRLTPHSVFTLAIPKAFPLPAGTPVGRLEGRGAAFDAVGLFATSSLNETTDFLLDVTYRDVGYTARTLRIQYAYLEWRPSPSTTVRAGKVTLPFGYLNQNLFYPFQRPSVSSATFASGILGLPIADLGASLRQNIEAGPVTSRLTGYVVNGYGPIPGTRDTFRSVSLPGGLAIANNLGSANPNKKISGGGRLAFYPTKAPEHEAGGSVYAGQWDAAGKRTFWMANGHARAVAGPVTVLGEYLHLDVEDDKGFQAALGGADWRTDGFMAVIEVAGPVVGGGRVTPWARGEQYKSRAAGGSGEEHLGGIAGGLSWRPHDSLVLKAEAAYLDYRLPMGGEALAIRGMTYVIGTTVTF